jgi:1A family penicillin-binding protein
MGSTRWPAWFWASGPRRPPRPWVRRAGWAAIACLGALVAVVAALPLPPPAAPSPTTIYDDRGRVLATLYPQDRIPVTLAEVPAVLQQAVIDAEDRDFYREFGINPRAILRAALVDLRARRVVEGGSTIAQQLAKALFLSPARTFTRKALEVAYTLKLEASYSKPQILQMYLNTVYFGDGAYGVGAAAETYFGKPVRDLGLGEAALLAGLIRAPETYNPYTHPAMARQVRALVLRNMVAAGDLTAAEAARAEAQPLGVIPPAKRPPDERAYLTDYLLNQVAAAHPELAGSLRRGGYRIFTTIDLPMQEAAERDFARYMPPGAADAAGIRQPQGALVALDPRTGGIRAMVGGRGDRGDTFNRAVDAHRQPGSTFKAFLYAAVVDAGYTVVDRQLDAPVVYPGADGRPYRPTDYGSKPYLNREVTVREAVALSDNVVAVKWANLIGPQQVIRFARRMGITSPLQPTLPLVLGAYTVTPLELADAYLPLANLGKAIPPWSIRAVIAPDGRSLPMPAPPRPRPALDPGVAYIVTSLLESVMTEGTGKSLLPILGGRPVAGKTGTTDQQKDAWLVGYTPDLVAAVWVGDDVPRPMADGYGSVLAGPVWAHFMADAEQGTEPSDWPQPSDVVTVRVSADDGLLPNPTSPTVAEVFLRGTAPTAESPVVSATAAPAPAAVPGDMLNPPEDWPPPPLQPAGVPPVAQVPLE